MFFQANPIFNDFAFPAETFAGSVSTIDTVSYAAFDSPMNVEVDLSLSLASIHDTTITDSSYVHSWRFYKNVREDHLFEIDNVIGSRFGDDINGDAGDNLLIGFGAGDGFTGRGDYRIGLSNGNFTRNGLESRLQSHDDLDGGAGNDTLMGDLGLDGGAFDILRGGEGDDVLDGGIGQGDEYYGGAGADGFVFYKSTGVYRIMDWTQGEDVILIYGEGTTAADVTLTRDGDHLRMAFDDTEVILRNTFASELDLMTDVVFA